MEEQRTREAAGAYILGGNGSTLAFVHDLVPEQKQITAWLVPLAWTPVGVVLGEPWQRVGIAADNVAGWTDQTFSADDPRSFVSPMRDLDLLLRVGWRAERPERLAEGVVLNPEDVPEDILDGLDHPPAALVQCAICRRTCVRDHFVWNDRRLCAWDYHTSVFGRRGPWRGVPYEERLFETLPRAPYVVGALLDEINVDIVLAIGGFAEALQREIVNLAIERGRRGIVSRGPHGRRLHAAARTPAGAVREEPGGSGINAAIGRLWIVFVACFAILAGRQIWLQVFAAERIASDPHNPRRGARDGLPRRDPRARRQRARLFDEGRPRLSVRCGVRALRRLSLEPLRRRGARRRFRCRAAGAAGARPTRSRKRARSSAAGRSGRTCAGRT